MSLSIGSSTVTAQFSVTADPPLSKRTAQITGQYAHPRPQNAIHSTYMRATTLTSALAATLLAAAVLCAAETVPPSLSDPQFWKLVTDFSEPGGGFVFEMFMSNEETFQEILPDLLKRVQPGGVYLGVA